MRQDISIVRHRAGDELKIFELYKAVYPDKEYDANAWLSWWRWMHEANPAGPSMIWVAEHNGKLVGQYPLFLMDIKIGDQVVKIAQIAGLMVHPDYRMQGLFSHMGKTVLEDVAKSSVSILIGFPNKNSYHGLIKAGWFNIVKIPRMLRPINWQNLLSTRTHNQYIIRLGTIAKQAFDRYMETRYRLTGTSNVTIEQVDSFEGISDTLWNAVSYRFPIATVRKKDYLTWRYLNHPELKYIVLAAKSDGDRIMGYLVYRYVKDARTSSAIICDVLSESAEVARQLIDAAVSQCESANVASVSCYTTNQEIIAKGLLNNGFIKMFTYGNMNFCAYSSHPFITSEFLGDSRNWFLAHGDSDLS